MGCPADHFLCLTSAFKHGVTEANIPYVLWRLLHEQLLEAYINKWLIVGYDTAGNLIEVAYNIAEADALDEEITKADITLKPGEGGIVTRQRKLLDV